jgi:hypothetical protein
MTDQINGFEFSGEDARFALAGIAAASARRNRPRWIFVAAAGVLGVCAIWTLVEVVGVSSARARLRDNESQLVVVREVSANIAEIRRSATDPDKRRAGEPLSDILQRLDRAGERNGLDVPIARESTDEVAGTIERQYIYSVSDDSLASLLGWVREATESIPGLEVYRISINPQGDRVWQLDVTFVRYERAS